MESFPDFILRLKGVQKNIHIEMKDLKSNNRQSKLFTFPIHNLESVSWN